MEQEANGRGGIAAPIPEVTMRDPSLLRIRLAVAAIALAMSSAPTCAADNEPAPTTQSDDLASGHSDIDKSKIDRVEPGNEWWRDVVAHFPGCTTLTDGCQSCLPQGDAFTCANPGIACLRGEWRCATEAKTGDEKTSPKP
jgi:hypothetical protein